jgi:hypothetical protein
MWIVGEIKTYSPVCLDKIVITIKEPHVRGVFYLWDDC